MSRALLGDVHGCIDELRLMHRELRSRGITDLWHAGDLIDRGPDSGAVVRFCIDNQIHGVMGNHEAHILDHLKRFLSTGDLPKNPDKARTIQSLNRAGPDTIAYLRALPRLHVWDDERLVLVHGGLVPHLPLQAQPNTINRLQMIHPDHPGETKWFNLDKKGEKEAALREKGWARWYERYDWDYDVVFGHSVFDQPLAHVTPGGGTAFGIDTGCVYGGKLTALILPERTFISIDGKSYAERRNDTQDP